MSMEAMTGGEVRGDAADMLWHFARGWYPDYDAEAGQLLWCKGDHRGVQRLDNVTIPRKEKRYALSPRFELQLNSAFEDVVRGCALQGRGAPNWITPKLANGYVELHRRGHAHSFEAWEDGRLAGGWFGVQIGGYISVESMFHKVSNASKAAYGHALDYLKNRGFELVDVVCVSQHRVNYGEEWVPQWEYDAMVGELVRQERTVDRGRPRAAAPLGLVVGLEFTRASGALRKRLSRLWHSGAEVRSGG